MVTGAKFETSFIEDGEATRHLIPWIELLPKKTGTWRLHVTGREGEFFLSEVLCANPKVYDTLFRLSTDGRKFSLHAGKIEVCPAVHTVEDCMRKAIRYVGGTSAIDM